MALSLDLEQQTVVDTPGSVICLAGPGSGKTRTLVAKAEGLWAANEDLICLTFTRSAAQEMRDRMPGIPARTVHSFCLEWVGWKGNYTQMLTDFQVSKWKPKYSWALVDEVQDLTQNQMDVVLSIAGESIFAVGDPYQSIYGFGGALGGEAVNLLKSKGCRPMPIKNNYRSNPKIVKLLNGIYPRGLVSAGEKFNGLTAVLARTNKLVQEVSLGLTELGIAHCIRLYDGETGEFREESFGDTTLKVMTCHASKGLEFDYVILYDPDIDLKGRERFTLVQASRKYPEERNLYYVSASRASRGFTEALSITQVFSAIERRDTNG